MVITKIHKTQQGRYALWVDGEFCFSIHKYTYCRNHLYSGLEVTIEKLEEMRASDEDYSAVQSALNMLSRMAQSSGRLREKLLRRYSSEATENALSRMTQLGLLNDLDYAYRLAKDMLHLRGWSLVRVRQELLRRKVNQDLVKEILLYFSEQDEIGCIYNLLLKKYQNELSDTVERRKVVLKLKRKGFRWESIWMALKQIEEDSLLDKVEE